MSGAPTIAERGLRAALQTLVTAARVQLAEYEASLERTDDPLDRITLRTNITGLRRVITQAELT